MHISELMLLGDVKKTLVIAPKRVAEDTWTREANKWDELKDLRVSKVLGSAKERTKALNEDADVYVINRENVQWLVETFGEEWDYDAVVIDELSSFKSASSKRWRMLKRVIGLSRYVIGLTGTPAPNGYLDLWPEMYLIDGGKALGKHITNYRDTYFIPGARKGYIVYEWKLRANAKNEIDRRLKSFCLSMSKEDWLSLPPIIFNEINVRMDSKERKLYEQFKQDQVLPLLQSEVTTADNSESAVIGVTAATVTNKLLQMANGAVYDDNGSVFMVHDRKLDALEELVEESQGQPLLVFYSYKHDLARIQARFPNAVKLETGSDIERWNNGEIDMLLCHPASAGHGLNLQEGGHLIVWFGLPWSLELYQQANARLYRQGQEKSVIVHHIVCEGTVDEKVLRVLQDKESTQASLLGALKQYLDERIES